MMGKLLGQIRLGRAVVREISVIFQSHKKPTTKMPMLLTQTHLGTD
jgi:hypothetical protein